jgi:catechol 2,3-dioxygenase-like lactoylglutathione lyase family enzyme
MAQDSHGVRLSAAVVFVSNLDRSVRFYTEVLGLPVVDQSPTAALLGTAGGPQLVLRAFGENAAHPLGALGVQYLVWSTDSRRDFDRVTEQLRQRSALKETRDNADALAVEGRDPDDLVFMIAYQPEGQTGMGSLPARIYAW